MGNLNNHSSQIIRNYIQSHYLLPESTPSAKSGIDQVMRMFELVKGESVNLIGVSGDDYIFPVSGKLTITDQSGKTSYIRSGRKHHSPYLIPEQPGAISVEACVDSVFYHVDSEKLDYLLAWDELGVILSVSDEPLKRRMDVIINSLPFSQLGIGNMKEALSRMHEVAVKKGDSVISEGESGKAYYVIAEGASEVWQTTDEEEPERIAKLERGDGFGEEGVVSGTHVNTVTMLSDGLLFALDKADFDDLLSTRMIEQENAEVAQTLLSNGYRLLDVRYDFELELYGSIQPSLHIPLHQLRERYTELNPDEKYVAYCKSGNRSQVACLLLEQRGIDAISLDGGISEWPYEIAS